MKRELQLYCNVLADKRTPRAAKWLLGFAVGYALLPVDVVPDFIPVVGHLDDLVIVPAAVMLALKLMPRGIVEEHRAKLAGARGSNQGDG
jgi:uncharacterized membrane protein YkvA (DUF1232 family)